LKISARRVDTATILDVSGNIDMSNSPEVGKLCCARSVKRA